MGLWREAVSLSKAEVGGKEQEKDVEEDDRERKRGRICDREVGYKYYMADFTTWQKQGLSLPSHFLIQAAPPDAHTHGAVSLVQHCVTISLFNPGRRARGRRHRHCEVQTWVMTLAQ